MGARILLDHTPQGERAGNLHYLLHDQRRVWAGTDHGAALGEALRAAASGGDERSREIFDEIVRVLQGIPGASSVKADQTGGAPTLDVRFDRAAIARYGLTVQEVADTVAAAMGGRESGLLFQGDRRFDITVRVPNETRVDLDAVKALPVMLPAVEGRQRQSVPLSAVAEFRFTDGLNQISRENGKRRVVVQANVSGRDVGSFVEEARAKVDKIELPAGYYLEWGGQFQSLQAASKRLSIVVPLCFLGIFGLLFMALGSFGRAVSVFLAVPLGFAPSSFFQFLALLAAVAAVVYLVDVRPAVRPYSGRGPRGGSSRGGW